MIDRLMKLDKEEATLIYMLELLRSERVLLEESVEWHRGTAKAVCAA